MSLKETLDRQKSGPSNTTDILDTNMLAHGQTDSGEKKSNKKKNIW